MPASRLPRRVLAANLQLTERQRAREEPVATQCWAGQVTAFLQRFPAAHRPAGNSDLIRVNPAAVVRQLRTQFVEAFNCNDVGIKTVDYRTMIRGGSIPINEYRLPQYLQSLNGRFHMTSLAQLRTGSHWLAVETGRWKRGAEGQRIPRQHRTCPHCAGGEVEDERHLIFVCPNYADLRTEHHDLFAAPDMALKDFIDQDPGRVAAFVAACRRRAAETTHDEDLQALFSPSQIEESLA